MAIFPNIRGGQSIIADMLVLRETGGNGEKQMLLTEKFTSVDGGIECLIVDQQIKRSGIEFLCQLRGRCLNEINVNRRKFLGKSGQNRRKYIGGKEICTSD